MSRLHAVYITLTRLCTATSRVLRTHVCCLYMCYMLCYMLMYERYEVHIAVSYTHLTLPTKRIV